MSGEEHRGEHEETEDRHWREERSAFAKADSLAVQSPTLTSDQAESLNLGPGTDGVNVGQSGSTSALSPPGTSCRERLPAGR